MTRRFIVVVVALVVLQAVTARAQQTILDGRVLAPNGRAVHGAGIALLRGRQLIARTVTDEDGRFSLPLPEGGDDLLLAVSTATRPLRAVRLPASGSPQRLRAGDLFVDVSFISGQGGPPPIFLPGPPPPPATLPPAPPPPSPNMSAPPGSGGWGISGPGARLSGWEFLESGAAEASGYGLYSYLLIPVRAQTGDAEYVLQVAVLDALMAQMYPLAEVSQYREPAELNVTYIPILQTPPAPVPTPALLSAYDHVRAAALLTAVRGGGGRGPYLVSVPVPLMNGRIRPERMLVQDLTGAPPRLASMWVTTFIEQVREPQQWDQPGLQRFVVRLRTEVARQADGFPQFQQALLSLVTLW